MTTKVRPLALCVDIDGEVNLVCWGEEMVTLFPVGSVVALTEIKEDTSGQVISWLFHFSDNADVFAASRSAVKLDYLEME